MNESAVIHVLRPGHSKAGDPPSGDSATCEAAERGGLFYAELHCLTHFSFQRGASSPEELVRRAWALGYAALAVTDECSVAGAVRAWQALGDLQRSAADPGDAEQAPLHAARAALGVAEPMRLLYGSEFRFQATQAPGEQGTLVALARDLQGWGDLCSFVTRCRAAAPKAATACHRWPRRWPRCPAASGCGHRRAQRRRISIR